MLLLLLGEVAAILAHLLDVVVFGLGSLQVEKVNEDLRGLNLSCLLLVLGLKGAGACGALGSALSEGVNGGGHEEVVVAEIRTECLLGQTVLKGA